MASDQTTYYELNQWQPEDKVLREEFNGDNSKVDAALHGLAEEVGARATRTEVEGIKTQLAAKAAQSALDSLSASVTAGLANKYGTDNPYLKAGNYIGTGTDSQLIPTGFRPSLVLLFCTQSDLGINHYLFAAGSSTAQLLVSGSNNRSIRRTAFLFQESGFSVNYMSGDLGLNVKDFSYHYLAFR